MLPINAFHIEIATMIAEHPERVFTLNDCSQCSLSLHRLLSHSGTEGKNIMRLNRNSDVVT